MSLAIFPLDYFLSKHGVLELFLRVLSTRFGLELKIGQTIFLHKMNLNWDFTLDGDNPT